MNRKQIIFNVLGMYKVCNKRAPQVENIHSEKENAKCSPSFLKRWHARHLLTTL